MRYNTFSAYLFDYNNRGGEDMIDEKILIDRSIKNMGEGPSPAL